MSRLSFVIGRLRCQDSDVNWNSRNNKLNYENTITAREHTVQTAGLLFTVVLGNMTSKSHISGFADDEDVETQSIRYSFCLSSGLSCASHLHSFT